MKSFFAISEIKPDLLHMLTIKKGLYGCVADKFRFKNGFLSYFTTELSMIF